MELRFYPFIESAKQCNFINTNFNLYINNRKRFHLTLILVHICTYIYSEHNKGGGGGKKNTL